MKNKIKYSEKDMAALIGEIESQFSTRLAKAEKDKTDLKKSESESVVAPKVEETKVVETAAPKEQGFNYNESDIAEMDALYGSMTKAEAEAHFESLKKALGKENEVKAEPKADEVVAKSEDKSEKIENKGESEETKLLKSEIETLKSEKEKLEKSFKDLTAKLTEFFKGKQSAPKQKAITKLEFVAKSEDEVQKNDAPAEDVTKLDKSEVSRRLTAKIRSGKLEKAEREKINEFYQSGSKNIESIRHLLTGGN